MLPASPTLHSLRQTLAAIGRDGARRDEGQSRKRVLTGHSDIDAILGNGLISGALHEILPQKPGDLAAATGFALGLVRRLAGPGDWIWIREDQTTREAGKPYGPGLKGFGLDPARLLLVTTRDTQDALKAAEDALRCNALGAVLLEPWGDPKALDLTATRRLTLAAEDSGVPLILLRSGGKNASGAARTRWVTTAIANEPGEGTGRARWSVALVLNRQSGAGGPGGTYSVEWSHDERFFRPADSVGHFSPSADGSAEAAGAIRLRRAL